MEQTYSFGYWVRRRRKACDLTQQELAERAGCTRAMIRKVEADERRPSRELAARLAEILVVPAEERDAFLQAARAQGPLHRLALAARPLDLPLARPHNLPAPPNPLVGRATETAAACALLRRPEVRLLTLTGSGGTGKTRLALQVAHELLDAFPDGIWFVDLAPIDNPGLTLPAIARALGLHEQRGQRTEEWLVSYLRGRQLLLILDNLEQILAAGPQLAELLAELPALKILATSRFALCLQAEHEYVVLPLGLPESAEQQSSAELMQYDAVKLFVERARAIQPAFAVDLASARAIAEICRRLDGLPLAIELAVAWLRAFTPEALQARLGTGLQLLVDGPRDLPARQQALRATLDWSYRLLSPAEQLLFKQLGCFTGGWTLAAAEAVAAEAVLGLHKALLEKSLVQARPGRGGEPRFALLETLREYALELLAADGEVERIRRRHAEYFVALAEQAAPELHRAQARRWLDQLDADWDNLRAALQWSVVAPGGAPLGLRLIAAIWWFTEMRGRRREGRQWLATLLGHPANTAPTAARANALMGAAYLADNDGELELAAPRLDELYRIGEERGDERLRALALFEWGSMARARGDPAPFLALLARSLAIFTRLGDQYWAACTLWDMGVLQAELPAREHYMMASLALARSCGDANISAMALLALAEAAQERGDLERAERLLAESLALTRALGDLRTLIHITASFGSLALSRNDPGRARTLYCESLELAQKIGENVGIVNGLTQLAKFARWDGDLALGERYLADVMIKLDLPTNPRRVTWNLHLRGVLRADAGYLDHGEALLSQALGRFRALQDRHGVAATLYELGRIAARQGDGARAEALLAESLRLYCDLERPVGAASGLVELASLAEARGHLARAALLWGAAQGQGAGARPYQDDCHPDDAARVQAALTRLSGARWAAPWSAGQALGLAEAVAEALTPAFAL